VNKKLNLAALIVNSLFLVITFFGLLFGGSGFNGASISILGGDNDPTAIFTAGSSTDYFSVLHFLVFGFFELVFILNLRKGAEDKSKEGSKGQVSDK
jgi:Na+-transporting methylmalonyl-CoA/oxaloacetate decarboxylase beta subunit